MFKLNDLLSEIIKLRRVEWVDKGRGEEQKRVLAAFEKASKERFKVDYFKRY